MECSSCAAAAALRKQSAAMVSPQYRIQNVEQCDYQADTLNIWLNKVKCFKDNVLYEEYTLFPKRKLNAYIGILLSALNSSNICYFKTQLVEIESFILFITTIEKC